MSKLAQLCTAICGSSVLFLTGCQHFTQPKAAVTHQVQDEIQGKPGEVTLNSAKTGLITAASPEELLERATGWQAPITHLTSWILAKPATLSAQISKDNANRVSQLIEDGWTVNFSYDGEQTLPNKLVLKQALAEDKENRITMVIQNR